MFKIMLVLGVALIMTSHARPQTNQKYAPMPYENIWNVADAPSNNYYGQKEIANDVGRVEGSYHVLLPDGRLMTVTYYVEGDSGFVSKISFQKDAKPFGR